MKFCKILCGTFLAKVLYTLLSLSVIIGGAYATYKYLAHTSQLDRIPGYATAEKFDKALSALTKLSFPRTRRSLENVSATTNMFKYIWENETFSSKFSHTVRLFHIEFVLILQGGMLASESVGFPIHALIANIGQVLIVYTNFDVIGIVPLFMASCYTGASFSMFSVLFLTVGLIVNRKVDSHRHVYTREIGTRMLLAESSAMGIVLCEFLNPYSMPRHDHLRIVVISSIIGLVYSLPHLVPKQNYKEHGIMTLIIGAVPVAAFYAYHRSIVILQSLFCIFSLNIGEGTVLNFVVFSELTDKGEPTNLIEMEGLLTSVVNENARDADSYKLDPIPDDQVVALAEEVDDKQFTASVNKLWHRRRMSSYIAAIISLTILMSLMPAAQAGKFVYSEQCPIVGLYKYNGTNKVGHASAPTCISDTCCTSSVCNLTVATSRVYNPDTIRLRYEKIKLRSPACDWSSHITTCMGGVYIDRQLCMGPIRYTGKLECDHSMGGLNRNFSYTIDQQYYDDTLRGLTVMYNRTHTNSSHREHDKSLEYKIKALRAETVGLNDTGVSLNSRLSALEALVEMYIAKHPSNHSRRRRSYEWAGMMDYVEYGDKTSDFSVISGSTYLICSKSPRCHFRAYQPYEHYRRIWKSSYAEDPLVAGADGTLAFCVHKKCIPSTSHMCVTYSYDGVYVQPCSDYILTKLNRALAEVSKLGHMVGVLTSDVKNINHAVDKGADVMGGLNKMALVLKRMVQDGDGYLLSRVTNLTMRGIAAELSEVRLNCNPLHYNCTPQQQVDFFNSHLDTFSKLTNISKPIRVFYEFINEASHNLVAIKYVADITMAKTYTTRTKPYLSYTQIYINNVGDCLVGGPYSDVDINVPLTSVASAAWHKTTCANQTSCPLPTTDWSPKPPVFDRHFLSNIEPHLAFHPASFDTKKKDILSQVYGDGPDTINNITRRNKRSIQDIHHITKRAAKSLSEVSETVKNITAKLKCMSSEKCYNEMYPHMNAWNQKTLTKKPHFIEAIAIAGLILAACQMVFNIFRYYKSAKFVLKHHELPAQINITAVEYKELLGMLDETREGTATVTAQLHNFGMKMGVMSTALGAKYGLSKTVRTKWPNGQVSVNVNKGACSFPFKYRVEGFPELVNGSIRRNEGGTWYLKSGNQETEVVNNFPDKTESLVRLLSSYESFMNDDIFFECNSRSGGVRLYLKEDDRKYELNDVLPMMTKKEYQESPSMLIHSRIRMV